MNKNKGNTAAAEAFSGFHADDRDWRQIVCTLFRRPFRAANYDGFGHWKQNHGGGLAPRSPENHVPHDMIPNAGSDLELIPK